MAHFMYSLFYVNYTSTKLLKVLEENLFSINVHVIEYILKTGSCMNINEIKAVKNLAVSRT